MALFRSIGARKDATRGTTALEVRKGYGFLYATPGVIPGATSPLVTGAGTMQYAVGAAGFVTQRAAGDGFHQFGNDGTVLVGNGGVGTTVGAAPGGGLQRIDITWVRQRSSSENADTTSEPDFGVTSGAAAATAIAPAIPAGAMEIGRNLMTSGVTSTASAGNTITQTAPVARLAGTQTPATAARASGATVGIAAWYDASATLSYTFAAGGWYLVNATGSVSTGGATAELLHRILVASLVVTPDYPVTAAPAVTYSLSPHILFQATSTATVNVSHQVYVPSPATGIILRAGHTISVARVA